MKHLIVRSTTSLSLALALMAGITATPASLGCASCGCSLSSDWESQGYSTAQGLKMDVTYMFLDQNQLRSGTHKISAGSVPAGQELEDYTHNNYVTLGLDYVINPDWGVSLQVPYIVRDHATFGEDHVSYDTSGTSSFGDIKLSARYQGFTPGHNLGVELGIKLPTGSFTHTFRSGEALDRGLQPGTGTTDIFASLYYFDTIGGSWGYFGIATVQTPLNSRDDYRPGTTENISLGLRYKGLGSVIPQLQLNGRISSRDTGGQSDNFDSGGSTIYLSPGFTVEATEKIAAYVFVQVPLYQNLNGYQLAPTWTLTAGIRATF